jgi:hypothetical protein
MVTSYSGGLIMDNKLTMRDHAVLNWVEQAYHKKRAFPSLKSIADEWPKTFPTINHVQNWIDSPVVNQALSNRGLLSGSAALTKQDTLSPAQSAAILTIANLSDRRSYTTKLKSLGITLTQWNAWKKQKAFRDFLHSQLTDDFETSLDRALSGLLKSVDSGNPRAVELYMEMTGRQPTENERNFKLAISRIVESVTRHVKDPTVIRAIAEDFEKIERGIDPTQTVNLTEWQAEPEAPVVSPYSTNQISGAI